LETAGLLELERYELLEGQLIRKTGKSRLHTLALRPLLEWLRRVFGAECVEQGVPVDLGPLLTATNELEPDQSFCGCLRANTAPRIQVPADLLLVVEVSATTRDYDLGAKSALYASAGLAEYWVIDLRDMRIVVHRNPLAKRYGSIVAYAVDEAVTKLAAESATIRLQGVFLALRESLNFRSA